MGDTRFLIEKYRGWLFCLFPWLLRKDETKMRLDRKVAIVTGGSSGMGKEISKLFAREGSTVAITDINEEAGREVVYEIEKEGGNAWFWKMDVSSEKNIVNVFKEIREQLGKISILINNAGVTGVNKPVDEVTEQEWDYVFNVDVKGVFLCTKSVIPYMRENGKGSIVNSSSL
jgi:NAD(P)-dependent dehydrogenase (short-subunit alcohol dehydrogenase family)